MAFFMGVWLSPMLYDLRYRSLKGSPSFEWELGNLDLLDLQWGFFSWQLVWRGELTLGEQEDRKCDDLLGKHSLALRRTREG